VKYEILADAGIVNRGNWNRLKKLMNRAQKGEEINIGFIGGSITQGCLADSHELSYSYRVYQWFVNTFADTKINYINAGIGGTSSQFGVARAESDLLLYKPDFVVTEFSVNDDEEKDELHITETYEGLIRKCYYSEKNPAVVIVNNVRYDTGENAQKSHNKVGAYYNLPCISMQASIYPKVRDKVIPNREITQDDLHPNNEGHELIAHVITSFLDKVWKDVNNSEIEVNDVLPPMTINSYENSKRFRNTNIIPVMEGYIADNRVQEGITDPFKKGWMASELRSKITFTLPCTGVAVQYRKSVTRPTPIARIVIDDEDENAIILDGNFDQDWGDCVFLQTVLEHADLKKRKIEIQLIETHDEDKVPFYLISIITT
jgi:lysophospholipase L1-like esterase